MAQRATTVREIFDAMPGKFLPEQAGDLQATIQFNLSGEGGGQWRVAVANRQIAVAEGVAANPTLTFRAEAGDYLALVNGELNPINAFMQGKVQITGDMALALKLQKLFGQ